MCNIIHVLWKLIIYKSAHCVGARMKESKKWLVEKTRNEMKQKERKCICIYGAPMTELDCNQNQQHIEHSTPTNPISPYCTWIIYTHQPYCLSWSILASNLCRTFFFSSVYVSWLYFAKPIFNLVPFAYMYKQSPLASLYYILTL